MRIIHLSTYDLRGGAARSAWRLHEGLRGLQADSRMLVRTKASDSEWVAAAPPPGKVRWRIWDMIHRGYVNRNRTEVSDTWFSLGYPGCQVDRHEWVRAADIIHLHWVAHFQSPPSIAALGALGKPLVWTLHDQRPFTGGCHFSAGCGGFENACHPCPQLRRDPWHVPRRNLQDQRELLPAAQLVVVAPGKWMGDAARRSAAFAGARIEVIPYGIDTAAFRRVPKAKARERFGIPGNRRCVLFGADSAEKRKGTAMLAQAFRPLLAEAAGPVELMYFGKELPEFSRLEFPVRRLGYLHGHEDLASAYSAADIFVLPSLEDNLPNTLLESLACGTPAAAFRVGGIPDVVEDGVTGRLAASVEPGALATVLGEMLRAPDETAKMGEEAERRIQAGYSLPAQASRYLQLYQSLARPKAVSHKTTAALGRQMRKAMIPLLLSSIAKAARRPKI